MLTKIPESSYVGKDVTIKDGVIIGENVYVEDNVYLDYGCIIKDNVHIKSGSYIGARCIIGEDLADFYKDKIRKKHKLVIGKNSLIRSGSIIYGENNLGDNLETGHNVTIREYSNIGEHVRIGTLSDIQGYCEIGNYVNMHSNVFIAQKSVIKDYVWLFPHVVLTDDPTPPSNNLLGIVIEKFASIAARSVILPGVHIDEDALVGSGSVVTKDVQKGDVVLGCPAKVVEKVTEIRNKVTGEKAYPWRYTFDRGMPWQNEGYDQWLKKLINAEEHEN